MASEDFRIVIQRLVRLALLVDSHLFVWPLIWKCPLILSKTDLSTIDMTVIKVMSSWREVWSPFMSFSTKHHGCLSSSHMIWVGRQWSTRQRSVIKWQLGELIQISWKDIRNTIRKPITQIHIYSTIQQIWTIRQWYPGYDELQKGEKTSKVLVLMNLAV